MTRIQHDEYRIVITRHSTFQDNPALEAWDWSVTITDKSEAGECNFPIACGQRNDPLKGTAGRDLRSQYDGRDLDGQERNYP